MTRMFLLLLPLTLASLAAAGMQNAAGSSVGGERIVRYDDRAKRIFVCASLEEIDTVAKARAILAPLEAVLRKSRPSWGNAWSASFFSDAKLAGYKTDGELQTAVTDGTWARAYIAEYDRRSLNLTLNPLDPKTIKYFRVALR